MSESKTYCCWVAGTEECDVRVTFTGQHYEIFVAYQVIRHGYSDDNGKKVVSHISYDPIGGPCDGQTYRVKTPGAAAAMLVTLRDLGYKVWEDTIATLTEEAQDD